MMAKIKGHKIGIAIVAVLFFGILAIPICVKSKEQNDLSQNDWALYNYGQEVEGTEGVAGVDINILDAWELSAEASQAVVGIVDTGIDDSCEKISDCMWVNADEISQNEVDDDGNGYVDDVFGWDFYNQDNTIYDGYNYDYHGTYIANMIETVAPGVKLVAAKFLKGTQGDAADAVDAIAYAIENGAEIINCSWCFTTEEPKLLELMSSNEDVLFVCAAGNSNLDLDENTVYPASYDLDNVISVMAIDNTGSKYDLSGYGMSVDIAAPGQNVWVEVSEGDQTFVSGTSVAVAFVTGAAALLKSSDNDLTAAEIKNILIGTAHTSESLKGLCAAGGYLDVSEALKYDLNLRGE